MDRDHIKLKKGEFKSIGQIRKMALRNIRKRYEKHCKEEKQIRQQ